jgi:yecA family protein
LLPRRHKAPTDPFADSAHFRPPILTALAAQPFTQEDRDSLGAWLAEGGWPRGHMDIATLEGYLVALLAWPVGVPPGAWLPPIWGGQGGWKVPAKVASQSTYTKFTELVVGFMRELDSGLRANPPRFAPTLTRIKVLSRDGSPGISWAQGFLRALQQNSQGLKWRSTGSISAVTRIARYASLTAAETISDSDLAADLTSAVLTLVDERVTRGPLGALDSAKPVRGARSGGDS